MMTTQSKRRPILDNQTLRDAVCSYLRTIQRLAESADRDLDTLSDVQMLNSLQRLRFQTGVAIELFKDLDEKA